MNMNNLHYIRGQNGEHDGSETEEEDSEYEYEEEDSECEYEEEDSEYEYEEEDSKNKSEEDSDHCLSPDDFDYTSLDTMSSDYNDTERRTPSSSTTIISPTTTTTKNKTSITPKIELEFESCTKRPQHHDDSTHARLVLVSRIKGKNEMTEMTLDDNDYRSSDSLCTSVSDANNTQDIMNYCLSNNSLTYSMKTSVKVSHLPAISNVALRCILCYADDAVFYCKPNGCGFCHECFNAYAEASFQDMGTYCREVQSSSSREISPIGALPCPYFERNGCPSSSIQMMNLNWTVAVFDAFRAAERRIGASEAVAAYELQQNTRVAYEQSTGLDGLMRLAVQDILSLGASVSCPNCGYRGEKDDACMHITCQYCRCKWCYCCGRRRIIGTNLCRTCDTNGGLLQQHSGWNNFVVEHSESMGYGALHEFHRKRMIYFLRRLIESVPDLPWTDFWTRNSTLLSHVPTPNRLISLDEIANATPPCFSPTAVESLQWLEDGQSTINTLREQSRRHVSFIKGSTDPELRLATNNSNDSQMHRLRRYFFKRRNYG